MKAILHKRKQLARAHGFKPVPCDAHFKVGIARNVRSGLQPIHGSRISIDEAHSQTGWFIWAGEQFSDDPDFFVPLHVSHLQTWCPAVLPYLELPPGWRFLIAPGHEDLWFDEDLDLEW